jgi:uncharacterized protein (UPF0179 family)
MTKKTRTTIPQANKVRAELQKEVGSTCPFCDSDDVGHFEIHHIDNNPSNNELRNLILLCPTCHSKITKGDIAPVQVFEKKIELIMRPKTSNKGQSISIKKINNAVIGDNNNVTIKQSTKKTVQKYPEGCIGHEIQKTNYVSHLIKRYNEYKENEVGKERMNYAQFGAHLKKQFKLGPTRTIYHVPTERFDELVGYIQKRINETTLAKKLGRGRKNFSTFDEYIEQTSGTKKIGE